MGVQNKTKAGWYLQLRRIIIYGRKKGDFQISLILVEIQSLHSWSLFQLWSCLIIVIKLLLCTLLVSRMSGMLTISWAKFYVGKWICDLLVHFLNSDWLTVSQGQLNAIFYFWNWCLKSRQSCNIRDSMVQSTTHGWVILDRAKQKLEINWTSSCNSPPVSTPFRVHNFIAT